MFDRFRESWAAPLGSVLLDEMAQHLLPRYLYRPTTVQATTASSPDESTIWLPADLDRPRPPQIAQLHQTNEPELNNMPYKVLAPRTTSRSASESTPKLTRQPKIACDACRSRKTANFLLEIPEENIVQVLHDAQAAPDLESYLAKARAIITITATTTITIVMESFIQAESAIPITNDQHHAELFERFQGWTFAERVREVTSWIWDFGFDIQRIVNRDTTERRWICKLCIIQRRPSIKPITDSGLQNATGHLYTHHRILAPDGKTKSREEKLSSGTSNRARSIAYFMHLNPEKPSEQAAINKAIQSFDRKRFQRLLVEWIVKENLPFSIAEHEGLRALFEYLNPQIAIQQANLTRPMIKIKILNEFNRHQDTVIATYDFSKLRRWSGGYSVDTAFNNFGTSGSACLEGVTQDGGAFSHCIQRAAGSGGGDICTMGHDGPFTHVELKVECADRHIDVPRFAKGWNMPVANRIVDDDRQMEEGGMEGGVAGIGSLRSVAGRS
ncbi:restless-like transposase [Apiospora kogelbergensis]|uniref:Restless-like transposase n=1 Tax=Apiospora kogelbergensis TaxID=1337665 RepID=A0AAW0QZJ1_9PEZI